MLFIARRTTLQYFVPGLAIVFLTSCAAHVATEPVLPEAKAELQGIIRNRKGVGIVGVEVGVWRLDRDIGYRCQTDDKGLYRVRVVPGGYRLRVGGGWGGVPEAFPDTVLHLGTQAMRFDYQYGGVQVTGRVLGPELRTIKSGHVEAHGRAFVTATIRNGHYEFSLDPGKYRLNTSDLPPGTPLVHLNDMDISEDTAVDLIADGKLVTGKVMFGDRIPNDKAIVMASGEPGTPYSAYAFIGLDGTYRMYLPRGLYFFSASSGVGDTRMLGPKWIKGAQKLDLPASHVPRR